MNPSLKYYRFEALLQQQGWLSPAYVGVNESGEIIYLSEEQPISSDHIESVNGCMLPGFQNAHSHAFQFAMAGMAERHPPGIDDDFWTWREAMYRCALSMNPDQQEIVATALYIEMLKRGYTHVAEFHYLHHDKDGHYYRNIAEMGERLISAAATAGIKITLVPVMYQRGGFGLDFRPPQRRFISKTVEEYLHLLDDSAHVVSAYRHARLGFGVHSLRAVEGRDIIETIVNGPKNIPFHLHVAEQRREIDDCLSYYGVRPVQWILQNLPLNTRFHLVHCTHLDDEEVKKLAQSGAHVVLCPGTEGNLGDGFFRLTDFAQQYGSWSIGTDSHISLNPLEDLRWLDYAQRLQTNRRNTFNDGASLLINKTLLAGRNAMGYELPDYFSQGNPLDGVVYDMRSPFLQKGLEHLLSSIIYTADPSLVLGTIVNGKWIIKNHQHNESEKIGTTYAKVIREISFL
jgi:formimidoylglutamate deiminase